MKCNLCSEDKLSDEFPQWDVTEKCDHPNLMCMSCTIKHVKINHQCPYPGCGQPVHPSSSAIKVYEATLSAMFTEYVSTYTPPVETKGTPVIHVTVLNGESVRVMYNSSMKVLELKENIKKKLKHEVSKQKLIYDSKELVNRQSDGTLSTLGQYGVQPNSTVYLMVLLYSIPEGFNHVVFDLYWGYPMQGRDYLDASCLVYSGTNNVGICDYRHRQSGAGLRHSGDIMDNYKRIGHHTINVHLKSIPVSVTKLFFTLSAWNSPDIARYPNPSLKFYEADKPNVDLCKTTFSHARHSQAVVMCSLSRDSDGTWHIYESGKLSSGNAENYGPLKSTIVGLINSGY